MPYDYPGRTGTPFVLGRRLHHDPRNLRYPVGVVPRRAITSVDWKRQVGIFDQGQVGSCTFNAAAGCFGTNSANGRTGATVAHIAAADTFGVFTPGDYTVQEDPFVRLGYTLTTKIDPFPGDYPSQDTGSDGPSAAMAMVLLGLADHYNHAFSVDALKSALQLGPVMWGTVWFWSMFDLDAHNYLVVDQSSGEAGGHEVEISGYDVTTDVYKVPNSWGTGFGDHGYFYVKGPDMATLLSLDGDITQPVWPSAPVPPKPVQITAQAFYDKIKATAKAGGLK
jgi:hypothetical protein